MPSEYNQGHVPGSLNIPLGNEQAFFDEIRGYDRVFLHCHSGRSGANSLHYAQHAGNRKSGLYKQFRYD